MTNKTWDELRGPTKNKKRVNDCKPTSNSYGVLSLSGLLTTSNNRISMSVTEGLTGLVR